MSDTATPSGDASAAGIAGVQEVGPLGMIMLRFKNGFEDIDSIVKNAIDCELPGRRLMQRSGHRAVAWMSPDEYLLILPREEVDATLAALSVALAGHHHLAADVSDARAMFRVTGPASREVIARLAPVDLERMMPAEVRRTRLAQVAAAIWAEEGGYSVVTFRSVAAYASDLLANAAATGPHRNGT